MNLQKDSVENRVSASAGAVVERYRYDAFGGTKVYDGSGSEKTYITSFLGNPYMFTARRYDYENAANLYYYRSRMYSPALGRFLQTDPIGYADSMNLYAYCGNNPLNWIDPWGWASVAIYHGSDKGDPRNKKAANGKNFRQAANDFDYSIDVDDLKDAVNKVRELKSQGIEIDDLYIFDHGASGGQELGDSIIWPISDKQWEKLANMVEDDGTIHLRGCEVALDELGKVYLKNMARGGKRAVDAYDGSVGYGIKTPFVYDHVGYGNLWLAEPEGDVKIISEEPWFNFRP